MSRARVREHLVRVVKLGEHVEQAVDVDEERVCVQGVVLYLEREVLPGQVREHLHVVVQLREDVHQEVEVHDAQAIFESLID